MDKNIIRVSQYEKELSDDKINVTIRLSNRCNFTCKYCTYHDNTVPFSSFDYYIKLLEKVLDSLIINKKEIKLYFHGGEPTIIPNFFELIQHIVNKYNQIKIIIVQTNGSQSKEWYNKFTSINDNKILFSFSYQNHMNKNFDNYYEKILSLKINKLLLGFIIMMENENQNEIINVIKKINNDSDLKKMRIEYTFVDNKYDKAYDSIKYLIYEEDNTDQKDNMLFVEYKDGTKENIKNFTKIKTDGNVNFENFLCSAGNKNLVIRENGDVYYCFSHDNSNIPAFNIFENNKIHEIMKQKYILCTHKNCSCELWLEKKSIYKFKQEMKK